MTPAVQPLRPVNALIRSAVGSICALTLIVADRYPASVVARIFWYAALAYLAGDLVFRAHTGYVRRRPCWTGASWRRYLIACAFPVAALVFAFWMTSASDANPALLGPRGSSTRDLWVAALTVSLLLGAIGVASAVYWLEQGDPAKPFRWPNLRVRTSV